MNVRELVRLLADEDPDAEVLVSADITLSRSSTPGILIFPTRCIEKGRFQSGDMEGRPWLSIVATDAWGISPPKTTSSSEPMPLVAEIRGGLRTKSAPSPPDAREARAVYVVEQVWQDGEINVCSAYTREESAQEEHRRYGNTIERYARPGKMPSTLRLVRYEPAAGSQPMPSHDDHPWGEVVAAAVRLCDAGGANEDLLRTVREMQTKAYPGIVIFGPKPKEASSMPSQAERCPAVLGGSVRCERVHPHSDPHENVNVGATWRNDEAARGPSTACACNRATCRECIGRTVASLSRVDENMVPTPSLAIGDFVAITVVGKVTALDGKGLADVVVVGETDGWVSESAVEKLDADDPRVALIKEWGEDEDAVAHRAAAEAKPCAHAWQCIESDDQAGQQLDKCRTCGVEETHPLSTPSSSETDWRAVAEKLREALAFYASRQTYSDTIAEHPGSRFSRPISYDVDDPKQGGALWAAGGRARRALKETETEFTSTTPKEPT